MIRFRDRAEAGQLLAAELQRYADKQPVVLALPRGGVPVGYEIAKRLDAPLDVWMVRKVGVPWHPELGVGAVAEGGYVYLAPDTMAQVGLGEDEVSRVVEAKTAEVEDRVRRFRGGRPRTPLRGRTIILVDDGIATGGTMRAAIAAIKAEGPRKLVLAVPVADEDLLESLATEVDDLICLLTPPRLYAIGVWYEDFQQVTDEEVIRLLELSRQPRRDQEQGTAQLS
jgi:putative phosphoribosyl transferase